MTVSDQDNRTSVVGTGAEQEIPFTFPITSTSDITVYKRLISSGAETELDETTHYTVVIDGTSGGTVTTVTPFFADTYQIHIIRDTPMTQTLDLVQGGSFNAENIETALDKSVRLIIENSNSLNRMLRFPETDATSIIQELPKASTRAGKFLYFGASDGNPSVAESITTGETIISTFGEELIDDLSASAALTTLGFTPFGKSLIDDISALVARGTLGLDTDDDVEFADGVFTDIITKSPYIDIRAYGAVGDDATDNTTAIQAVMTAAEANGLPVYIPKGIFLTGPISLGNPDTATDYSGSGQAPGVKRVFGPGRGYAQAVIKAKSGEYGATDFVFTRRNQSGIDYSGFTIDGNTVAYGGLDCQWDRTNSSQNIIENILIRQCTKIGANLDAVYDSKISGLWIREIVGTDVIGLSIQGSGGQHTMDSCWIATGVVRLASQNFGITNCGFFDGVELTQGGFNHTVFSGCHLYENSDTEITVNSTATGNATRGLIFNGCYFAGSHTFFEGRYHSGAEFNACRFIEPTTSFFNSITAAAAGGDVPIFSFKHCSFSVVNPISIAAGTARVSLEYCKDTDGSLIVRQANFADEIATLANDGTPTVTKNHKLFKTGGTTTITDFDDGVAGQVITVLCKHSLTFDFTTAQDADHNLDGSSANITADTGDVLKFLCEDGTTWQLISNNDASVDNN